MFGRYARVARIGAVALGSTMLFRNVALNTDYIFNTNGLEVMKTAPGSLKEWSVPMGLAAIGMRKKNFYVVAVDVYLVGLYLSPSALQAAKKWRAGDKSSTLADTLLELPAENRKSTNPKVVITLRMVRDLSTKQIVDAFNDAFRGLPAESINSFAEILSKAVGSLGVGKGEDVTFIWLNSGGLYVMKNKEQGYTVIDEAIERRLLETYCDPKRAVSPELLQCVDEYILKLQDW